ncbi:MAG: hypothetical protein RLZZ449_1293 [Actinomycetota bacterium]
MNLTFGANSVAVAARSGISRRHGSHVEYQKLMTRGLPIQSALEIDSPPSLTTSTGGSALPTTDSFVESCG